MNELKFYTVSRPYCSPSKAFTFALNHNDAVEKVAKKYGYVKDSKAYELLEDEFKEFVS